MVDVTKPSLIRITTQEIPVLEYPVVLSIYGGPVSRQ